MPGIGYKGVFEVNPRFDLRNLDDRESVKGHATPEGTASFAKRAKYVHESNFKSVKMPGAGEPLTLSKMMYGSGLGDPKP